MIAFIKTLKGILIIYAIVIIIEQKRNEFTQPFLRIRSTTRRLEALQ